MTEGVILDVHPDRETGEMVLWVRRDDGGAFAIRERWSPTLHVAADPIRLDMLEAVLAMPEVVHHLGPTRLARERHRLSLEDREPQPVLAVTVQDPRALPRTAAWIDAQGDWHHHALFSVDQKLPQRWLHTHGLHPFGRVRVGEGRVQALDGRDLVDWPIPPLRILGLHVICIDDHGHRTAQAPITGFRLTRHPALGVAGEAEEILLPPDLSMLQAAIDGIDPDVLLTDGGDTVDLPALRARAFETDFPLRLGRAEDRAPRRHARTAWSYGRLLRKEAYHALSGRLHVDLATSFITKEGGIAGLLELARLSGLSAQDLARLSPGSAISAMQLRQAMEDGVLVPWKKNRPEDVKTGDELLLADRGGLYMEPVVGVHHDVVELDFASLFPSIIVTRNISPETLNCGCCTAEGPLSPMPLGPGGAARQVARLTGRGALPVPELRLHACTRQAGFLGRVVAPIIERRRRIKAQRRRKGDLADRRQNVLKWILVTCFGYTGYRNARFGRIECHEAICAWAREIILQAKAVAEAEGWTVLHAIVDSMWMRDDLGREKTAQRASIDRVIALLNAEIGIPIDLEDTYRWIGFIPNRTNGVGALTKYFGFGEAEGWKVRGIELRQHSTCSWVSALQTRALEMLEKDPSSRMQEKVSRYLHSEVGRLERGEIPLADLLVKRRIQRELADYRVRTITVAALERAAALGRRIPPGHKAGFAVTDATHPVGGERVRLASEVRSEAASCLDASGDPAFYRPLALRAVHAILSPFGWSEARLAQAGATRRQSRLAEWA